MKQIKSTLNINTSKGKNTLTNLFFTTNIPEKKYYYSSPAFQTQIVSILSSENIIRNQFSKLNFEGGQKKKNINLQFKMKSYKIIIVLIILHWTKSQN